MAVDPYVKRANPIPHKGGLPAVDISALAKGIKRVKAGDTSGLGNQGGNQGGGGGGGGAVAPTALDSLPKTPEIQALIDKGLLRADMAPEQILAIVGMSAQVAGIPIDIAALKAQLAADYKSTTGGILGMGADWMQQMFGANMPDGNAAAYAADPMFAQYAESLGNQQATAGLNQATDQAWFDKQQQAMTDYYNGLIQSIAMGAPADSGGGGGGGGGGRRRGGGGGSGGGSGGDGDWGFTDPVTTSTQTEKVEAKSADRESAMWPDYKNEVYDAAVAAFGVDDPRTQYVLDTLDTTTGPDPALEQVANDMTSAQTTIANRNALDENNKTWTQAAPANFEQLRSQYEQLTGQTLGDDPNTDEFEWQRPTEGVDQNGVNLATIAPGSIGAQIIELMDQAYDPANPNALQGFGGGTNEGFDNIAALANRILATGADRREAKQGIQSNVLAGIQNMLANGPVSGKGSNTAGVGSPNPAPVDLNTLTTMAQQNPYTPAVPGAYSPLSSANTGSISGGPGTSQLTPGTVANGTYVPALNQTPQGDNVSPYDSDLGRPLRNLYEQLAQQNDLGKLPPTSIYGQSAVNNPPAAGSPNPSDMLNSSAAPVDVYDSDLGRPLAELQAQLGQTGGTTTPGVDLSKVPPNILQAAAQAAGGPPSITDIQHELLQAGLPLLNIQGGTTSGPTYGPSGNTRPMFPQDAIIGMPTNGGGKVDPRTPTGGMSKAGVPNQQMAAAALARILQSNAPVDTPQSIAAEIAGGGHGKSEGPITGGTIYDQIIGNVAVTPETTDQFGRTVPSKLRDDLLGTMQQLSAKQKMEDSRGIDPTLFNPDPGTYYEGIKPELSGEALADAQMINILAPGLRDMIRAHSTLWDMNPYSRHVDNTGTSTQQLQTKQKTYDPDVANAVAAGDLNDLATVPDLITQPYDEAGQPIYDEDAYVGGSGRARRIGNIVDENIGGGGGSLKSMAIRRIAQPTPKAPITTGKSKLKPGSSGKKTYSKAEPKRSYVTNTKTLPYTPKQKKKYGK